MSRISNMKYLVHFQEMLYKRYAVWTYQKRRYFLLPVINMAEKRNGTE